jgi:hypothetical protein
MSRRAAANTMSAAAQRGPPEHTLGRCGSDALFVADEFGVTRPTIDRHLQRHTDWPDLSLPTCPLVPRSFNAPLSASVRQ